MVNTAIQNWNCHDHLERIESFLNLFSFDRYPFIEYTSHTGDSLSFLSIFLWTFCHSYVLSLQLFPISFVCYTSWFIFYCSLSIVIVNWNRWMRDMNLFNERARLQINLYNNGQLDHDWVFEVAYSFYDLHTHVLLLILCVHMNFLSMASIIKLS